MKLMPSEIRRFIKEHHVMTIASTRDGVAQCANLFYAYMPSDEILIFTSSLSTEHGANMKDNSTVAASIVVETKVVGKVRGIQIKGSATLVTDQEENRAKLCYLKRFPFAVLAPLELWALKIESAKLTDNRLGFGKKTIWNRDEE